MEQKLPDIVICPQCKTPLDLETSQAVAPADTPREKITHIFEPRYPHFSVQCENCGQYLIFVPFAHDGDA